MPKRNGHVPGYLLHKPSGQARVIIDGKHVYLGEYGSPESHEKYARSIAEFSKPAVGTAQYECARTVTKQRSHDMDSP